MTHEQAVRTFAAERYLLGEMSELEQQDFEAHYFDCAECADDVRSNVKMACGITSESTAARFESSGKTWTSKPASGPMPASSPPSPP
jgi:anti-sigma factor RsiW